MSSSANTGKKGEQCPIVHCDGTLDIYDGDSLVCSGTHHHRIVNLDLPKLQVVKGQAT